MQHHIHPLENCLARILVIDTDFQPIPSGAGVLLHGKRVLTCAHVVNTALKLSPASKDNPGSIVVLDFPLSGSKKKLTAKVGFWDPETDLAELIIIGRLPSEVSPVYLRIPTEMWDHRVQAFGFPNKNLEGTWADCQLRGPNVKGWVEIFDPKITGNFIKQGFSGGPVWDSQTQSAIGIIVAVEKNNESRVGYLIPTRKIAEKWKKLPVEKPPSWMKRFSQKPPLPVEKPPFTEFYSVHCSKCGSSRDIDTDLPCPACGARRTLFGYQYENEYHYMLKMIVFLLTTILLVIISGIMFVAWLTSNYP